MIKRKITFIRRIIQITAFILVFYGGWLFGLKRLQITWWAFEQNKTKAIKLDYDNPTHTQSLQTFLPTRSCRFAGNTGIFRGCMMFFLSDILTWHPPLEKILPHLILLLVLMIVFGRIWCGWFCPIGFISEIVSEIRKIMGIPRKKLSPKIRTVFKVVAVILLVSLLAGSLIINFPFIPWSIKKPLYLATCQICPSKIIAPLLTGFPLIFNLTFKSSSTFILVNLFVLLMILTLIYILSFIFKRPWCKICPNGLIISFFNKYSLFSKQKDLKKCTRCGICANCCPMETTTVYDEKEEKNVDHRECIECFSCVDLCPEKDCLKVTFVGKEIFKS